MATQLENLERVVALLERTGNGKEGPFLRGLRQQLAAMRKNAAERQDRQEQAMRLHAGTRSSEPAARSRSSRAESLTPIQSEIIQHLKRRGHLVPFGPT